MHNSRGLFYNSCELALPTHRGDFVQARSQATQLSRKIGRTSVFARTLSRKIRQLDEAQSRVRDSLDRVDSVLDLKVILRTCIRIAW